MPAQSREGTSPDSPYISPEFLQGDIRAGLEKMRRRLLDLTSRNKLLNFRHPKKSTLRVVDELPDQLFEMLLEGKALRFRAVPRPRGLRRALAEPELQFEADLLEDGTQADRPPNRPAYPSAREHAESLGLNTEFELPLAGANTEETARYTDRDIQTLHYPDELEAILRSIHSAARLVVEETGTNMLYLVAGFLEWYESVDSTKPRLAPLVLLPVILNREQPDDTGSYRYSLQYSGEEVVANISLQERLRNDFGIELPELSEDDTPEAYFERVRGLLGIDERWRVQRKLTLTLLSFGKLLMYRDLDPTTWPPGQGPAEHPRIKELFEGVQRDEISFAPEYPLDDSSMPRRVPPVVDEADSSQHSALVDALDGRNLVIEGPPGTGKSQTITNLIAAAIASGKRVLFVSEKLAALEVVRHRLGNVGLGSFCLELHSHKTQKRRLLDDLDERLQLHGHFPAATVLDEKLKLVAEDRRKLTQYVELINKPFGCWEQTLHDVIWASQRRKHELRFESDLVEAVRLPNVRDLSVRSVADLRQVVEQFVSHLTGVSDNSGRITTNAWFGIANSKLTFMDADELTALLGAFVSAADELRTSYTAANELVNESWLFTNPDAIQETVREAKTLPADVGPIVSALLPRLRDARLTRRLREFAGVVHRYNELRSRLHTMIGGVPPHGTADQNELSVLFDRATSLAPGAGSISDIATVADGSTATSETLDEARSALATIAMLSGTTIPFTVNGLTIAGVALGHVRTCPSEDLGYRHEGLTRADALPILERAEQEAAPLRSQRARLAERFDLRLMPDTKVLSQHVVVAANAKWWSWLSSEYRSTRRAYVAMALGNKKPSNVVLSASLRELLEFAHRQSRFNENADYRDCMGEHCHGIDSPLEALRRVAAWYGEMTEPVAHLQIDARPVASALWKAPREYLAALQAKESSERYLSKILERAATRIGPIALLILRPWAATDDADLGEAPDELKEIARAAAKIVDDFRHAGIPTQCRLADASELLKLLGELQSVETLIATARDVADALKEYFDGAETDLSRVANTIALYNAIASSSVPEALKQWLISPEAPTRLEQLHNQCVAVSDACSAYTRTWDTFATKGAVRSTDWNGSPAPWTTIAVPDAIARSERALAGQEALPSWCDYLRARDAMTEHGIVQLVELAERGAIASTDVLPAFNYVAANSLVQEAFRQHPELALFSGLSHDQVRKRFAKMDRETMLLYRQNVGCAADQRLIPSGNGRGPVSTYTERSLLEREIDKQKRHLPVRQLMLRAGRALQALKPCFMMGPLSVAKYLAPGALEFDMVIMDEASQLKPEDALGTIARARQTIIVGDRMQLPPTSFFDRLGEEESPEDDEGAIAAEALSDAESILDVASGVYKPARLLRWHYRSRHGSLIAFSNKEFYKGQLVVFPSPVAQSNGLGVKLIHVREGVYENRRNILEAKRVVSTALRHMRERAGESLGIVTLNATQRELVEGLFEQELKADPIAQRYIESRVGGLEPFIIKNLENVQGDERDVIYISITFGPSANGHVFQRFGPINGITGHRRLNVLFTRARRRVVVFSSMLAEDIVTGPDSAWGVRALKGYLHFAQTGILEQASFSGREPDSDFEIEVAEALRTRGLEVVAQVGVAGYYIDLAVKHPQKPNTFILGIECDGKTYHSSVTARDRDRLRQSILEGLGWNIHRIWSTDWFKASAREVERVVARVETVLRGETTIEEVLSEDCGEDEATLAGGLVASTVGETEDTWEGEVACQPLSASEVRERLLALRDEIERTVPSGAPSTGLLRDEMVDAFIRTKPRSKDDWLRKVSLDLRLDTDGTQIQSYLSRVLELTSMLAP